MTGSIVIPAHNEETLLPRCLAALAAEEIKGINVVVVVNGSTDRTAEVARQWSEAIPGLTVMETEVPGKAHALNLGDAHAEGFPRLYLDADITLTPGALPALFSALRTDEALAAAPSITFDIAKSDPIVRGFYAIYRRLPYVSEGLIGLGVYALSENGRRRFDQFPALTADDLFVQRLFTRAERRTTPGHFVVRAPRRWRDLLRVRIRTVQGTKELEASSGFGDLDLTSTTGGTVKALGLLVARNPALIPSALAYLGITVLARVSASRPQKWYRDESSRTQA
ncbi:glycosyltransferase family 2 protein [Granulicoccus sp. GXG6511]|uniref:glycosyltransferase family 2 protein n=1 Tax=Granulicoccus sp. GXG6511 TaxID=3381351 RepID=UPI003D7E5404